MIVRLLALGLFLAAAFLAFGDVLLASIHSAPQNFLNEIGHAVRSFATSITDWLGIN